MNVASTSGFSVAGFDSGERIAIIGMAGRFPGAASVEAFWRNIREGVDSISRLREQDLEDCFSAETRAAPAFVAARPILDGVDQFDAEFFGMYPREAALTDPQHRVFMECAWEALESAGYDPGDHSASVGVIAGCSLNTYFLHHVCADRRTIEEFTSDFQLGSYPTLMGAGQDFLSTRVAYKLDLRGPAMTLGTACSTSLTAVVQACQCLHLRQADMMLAGGVSISFPQKRGYTYQKGGMASADGTCRPFDAAASGTVFGSGAAVVLLRRLDDAVAAGDTIHAVIRAASANNDGARKIGFTAPSVEGQVDVICDAHRRAGIDARSIGYVECHGTATPLGDPIEFAALTRAFRTSTEDRGFCALGSTKANIGHLDAAAGVAGLIKAALAVRDGVLPPLAHFESPNPLLNIETSPFCIDKALRPWPEDQRVRRAGVSALGVGGTNVHVVIEEAPAIAEPAAPDLSELRPVVLPLSARTPAALQDGMAALGRHLAEHAHLDLADVAYTLQTGRRAFEHRTAVAGRSRAEIIAALHRPPISESVSRDASAPVIFMFPGQGAQYAGMGRGLYAGEPLFRAVIDDAAAILNPLLGTDLRDLLRRADADPDAASRIRATRFAQPALFVTEYATARLWMSWGITPAGMIGHSIGELVCATLAEAIDLEDALRFVAERGRLMQDMPPGGMLAVRLSEDDLAAMLPHDLAIAAVNGPRSCVVSGAHAAVDTFKGSLAARKVAHRDLQTSHAFHSPMMDPVLDPLVEHLASVSFRAPQIPYVSGVTGDWAGPAESESADYWARHCRSCIRFSDALATVTGDDKPVLLEVGPGHTLGDLSVQVLPKGAVRATLASLPAETPDDGDQATMMNALGRLWSVGATPLWEAVDGEGHRRVPLPTYPFERKTHWIAAPARTAAAPNHAPVTQTPSPVDPPSRDPAMNQPAPAATANPGVSDAHRGIKTRLCAMLQELSGETIGDAETGTSFLDLGFDSLFLAQLVTGIGSAFGVTVTFRQLIDDLTSVESLADHIASRSPVVLAPEPPPQAAPAVVPAGTIPLTASVPGPTFDATQASSLSELMKQQLATLQAVFAQQVQALGTTAGTPAAPPVATLPAVTTSVGSVAPPAPREAPVVEAASNSRLQVYTIGKGAAGGPITARQQGFIDDLTARYTARTSGSKEATQKNRAVLADPRAAAGFRRDWKDLVYPIVCARSQGSKLWDVDDNAYIDLVNGYGQTFFGHAPDFVTQAVAEQLSLGFAIGPQTLLAGEVADRVSRLTGNERVTFCNTGSEAVMAAMRVSRTVTGRNTVVIFDGAYHGQFDEVLVKGAVRGAAPGSKPAASGIPPASVANMVVLPYGTAESLAWIRDNASSLAAVIVEPVQSRHPGFVPRDFIAELRNVTAGSGSALIFDEVVTGFRTHPGGMQAVLGIRADLVTYGKVVGGGMPIGVLAGMSRFMDALDGGHWRFGDESFPEVAPTFFAGTFVRHPLALAAARAVLERIESEGPDLQQGLATRTANFVERFNADLARRGLTSRAECFSSWFYVSLAAEDRLASLFYHHCRLLGVHIQEGFPCFVTTAHSADDLDQILTVFSRSLDALQDAGILTGPDGAAERPAALPDRVPWTEPQKEIWLTAQLGDDASCGFNESLSLTFEGDLDRACLGQALNEVVMRHDSLRSRFDPSAETMIVAPTASLDPTVVDLRGAPAASEELQDLLDADARTPFDLINGPLLRAMLVTLDEARHVLVLTAHHIICDGWSFNVIVGEITACYLASKQGRRADLPPVPSFRSYALGRAQASDTAAQAETYWLNQFPTAPVDLELPSDRPRPARKTFAGASHRETFEPQLLRDLKLVGAKKGCTLFVTLLTALQVVLGRLSGEDDVVVAIPTAGQSLAGTNGLVGHCVNLLPLRVRLDWDASVMTQARATRSLLLDAFEHQDVTYGTLVRKLGHARDQSRLPLTQIQFNLEKLTAGPDIPGLVMTSEPNPKAFTNFDLFFNFIESSDGLRLDCDYNTDLFDVSTIRRWVGHMRMVIAAMIQGDVATVGTVPLLSTDECRSLVARLNDTGADDLDLRPVHLLIAEQAARTPDATAVVWHDETLSFSELDRRANRLARLILDRVPATDGRVAIATSRSLNLMVAMLAVMKAGHAYVPLDLQQPAVRQAMILADARVAAIVSDAPGDEPFTDVPTINLVRDEATIGALSGDALPTAAWRSADSAAYVIFTSGSTGRPKGVVITHRSLANLLWSMARRPGFTAKDTLLAVTTIAFDIAGAELLLPLLAGGRVVIADRAEVMDGFGLVARMRTSGASVVQATPSLWRLLIDAGFRSWVGLTMICGGEPLPRDLADLLLEGGGALWNAYGPTETTIWSSLQQVHPGPDPITIGTPLLNTQFHVLDARDQLTPAGVSGELFIGGDGLALGYFDRADLTAQAFRAIALPGTLPRRLYRTGDRARRMVDGSIQLIGRTDNQIKLRGFRIELEEVETVLRRCPGVGAVAVSLRDLPGSDQRLVGYVVPAAGTDVTMPAVSAFAAASLPDYMVPKAWVRLSALPLTPNGKLDRRGLLDIAIDDAAPALATTLPTTPMQVRLSEIFRDVLHLARVGIDDNLFSLGADSLQLFRMAARMRKAGIGLDVRDLLRHPTIAELAEVAEASESRPELETGPSLRAFRRKANAPVGLRQ